MNEDIERDQEIITHAVVFTADGTTITGKSHADCFYYGHKNNIKMSKRRRDQGFKTNKRHFISREDGAILAFSNGQINEKTSVLLSEDLWSKQYSGKHEYDELKGYFINENENKEN